MGNSIAAVAAVVFGLAVGSFLNVLIVRLPASERITGRSRCPRCRKPIAWFHNVPVLSYLFLGGRCAHCKKRISWQYPAVELATALLFMLVAMKYFGQEGLDANSIIRNFPPFDFFFSKVGGTPPAAVAQFAIHQWLFIIRDLTFVAVLVAVFVIDLKYYLILDVIVLPAAVLAVIANLLLGRSWVNLAIGAILGTGFFLLQYWISRGRWIGDGDVRLGLLLGLMVGYPGILVALFFAYSVGAVVGVALLAARLKRFGSVLPFGTFLSAGGIFTLLYGEAVVRWYLGMLGLRVG